MNTVNKNAQTNRTARDYRARLTGVRVLVADRDRRTASLVHSVLTAFGFQIIEVATSGNEAIRLLREYKFDLIVTEWNLAPVDGVQLVKAIRMAKNDQRLKRDIPIIMLTGKADKDSVQIARDAGITEFLVKPFSAGTLSHRLVQVIDNPRVFVDAPGYTGPCRRRRGDKLPDGLPSERRGRKPKPERDKVVIQHPIAHEILPPNRDLKSHIGDDISAADIFTEAVIEQAQVELLKSEDKFIGWAEEDIMQLEKAYQALKADMGDLVARESLLQAAYAIKSQAGIFGYDLGTEVGKMLVDYINAHEVIDDNALLVIRKHIDTMEVVFRQRIKERGQAIGQELISSLQKLIVKIG